MITGPDGKQYKMLVANGINKRAQVMNGTAYKTSHGAKGLKKSDLKMKNGRIVSVKASASATCISPSVLVSIIGSWARSLALNMGSGMVTIWAFPIKLFAIRNNTIKTVFIHIDFM